MGYFITSEPENAVPGKSCASLKTHTPGSRLQERGVGIGIGIEFEPDTDSDPDGD